jgi:hypothetical protein
MTYQTFHAEAIRIAREELGDADAAVHTTIEMRTSRRYCRSEWRIILVSDLVPEGAMSVVRAGPEVLGEFRVEVRFVGRQLKEAGA